jgi:hypothetical protein
MDRKEEGWIKTNVIVNMESSLVIVVPIFIILIIIAIYTNIPPKPDALYLTVKEATARVVRSPYFHRMNATDLKVRGAETIEGYRSQYISCLKEFDENEKELIDELVSHIRLKLYSKCAPIFLAVPWNFAKLDQRSGGENGYPHTLEDMIALSPSFFQLTVAKQYEILLHEHVHVFQRLFPEETKELIRQWQWEQHINKAIPIHRIRNNPDLDSFNYRHIPSGLTSVQLYLTDAKTLADSVPVLVGDEFKKEITLPGNIGIPYPATKQWEHPFETMACLLPLMMTGTLYTYRGLLTPSANETIQTTWKWLKRKHT